MLDEILNGIEPVVDGLRPAERGADPVAQQPLTEGRAAAVEPFEEAAVLRAQCRVEQDVQVAQRHPVDDHVRAQPRGFGARPARVLRPVH